MKICYWLILYKRINIYQIQLYSSLVRILRERERAQFSRIKRGNEIYQLNDLANSFSI